MGLSLPKIGELPFSKNIISIGLSAIFKRWAINFDGVNQYAKMKPWAFSGFGDTIEFSVTPDAAGHGVSRYILSSDANYGLFVAILDSTNSNLLAFSYVDENDSPRFLFHAVPTVPGETYECVITFLNGSVEMIVNGHSAASQPHSIRNDATMTAIGVSAADTSPMSGRINYVRLNNATALQGVNAVQGNGVGLWAQIPEITLEEDFDISFWWIRKNNIGSGDTELFGTSDSESNFFRVYNSDHGGVPNQCAIKIDGASSTFGLDTFESILQGQPVHIRLLRDSGDNVTLELDGVDVGVTVVRVGPLVINGFGQVNGVQSYESIIYDPVILDKTAAVTVGGEIDITDPADILLNDWEDLGSGSYLIEENAGSGGSGLKFAVMTEGEYYKVKFEIYDWVSGAATLYGGAGGGFKSAVGNSNNFYEGVIVASAQATRPDQIQFYASDTTSLKIRGITVESVTSFETYSYDLRGENGEVIANTNAVTGVLGSEKLTNYDFSNGLTGWSSIATAPQIIEAVELGCRLYSEGANAYFYQIIDEAAYYQVTIDVVEVVYGSGAIWSSSTLTMGNFNEVGTYTHIFQAEVGDNVQVKRSTACDFTIGSFSLKKIADGVWQNYDQSIDQVEMPQLSRNYTMDDGPTFDHLKDKLDTSLELSDPSIWGAPSANVTTDESAGEIHWNGLQNNYNGVNSNVPRAIGDYILVRFEIFNWQAGMVQVKTTGGGSYVGGADGFYEYISICDNDSIGMMIQSSGNTNLFHGSIRNISIRKVSHAKLFNVEDWEKI